MEKARAAQAQSGSSGNNNNNKSGNYGGNGGHRSYQHGGQNNRYQDRHSHHRHNQDRQNSSKGACSGGGGGNYKNRDPAVSEILKRTYKHSSVEEEYEELATTRKKMDVVENTKRFKRMFSNEDDKQDQDKSDQSVNFDDSNVVYLIQTIQILRHQVQV